MLPVLPEPYDAVAKIIDQKPIPGTNPYMLSVTFSITEGPSKGEHVNGVLASKAQKLYLPIRPEDRYIIRITASSDGLRNHARIQNKVS